MDQASGIEAKRIRVNGRVQGVFFRAAAKREAESLGLTGWARNDDDGAVTIEVEGAPESIGEFLDWCKVGSSRATIERFEVSDISYTGLDGFHIS